MFRHKGARTVLLHPHIQWENQISLNLPMQGHCWGAFALHTVFVHLWFASLGWLDNIGNHVVAHVRARIDHKEFQTSKYRLARGLVLTSNYDLTQQK